MEQKRILVVDDEPQVTLWLKLLLTRSGQYDVREENNPCNAVKTALEFEPDMVFSDIDMPEMDGGDVAAALKRDYRQDLPIVFLSSLVSKQEAADGSLPIAGYEYLAKPIRKGEVLRAIEVNLGVAGVL